MVPENDGAGARPGWEDRLLRKLCSWEAASEGPAEAGKVEKEGKECTVCGAGWGLGGLLGWLIQRSDSGCNDL